ncbi:FAD-dependent oxidoreductase [Nocardia panacis]|uniref:FAD-dependent oxidoreductase n=1 Tax=Nocardia panacis TaxID=2340916 RepID=UPI00193963B9|nr:FAD-dependent oxidoreductase [Nocardia panacis]
MGERVLVVGAGLAGLASAAFLARRGVEVLLVERRSGTSLLPRAVGQNQRTMELLGFAGIADDVPGVRPSQTAFPVRVAATATGPTLREILPEAVDPRVDSLSPALIGTLGQEKLEPVLRAHAEKYGAELCFDTELVSFDQDSDGVTAVLRWGADTTTVRAAYLVAADGNRSGIRSALGIDRHGPGGLAHNVSIIFDADLREALAAHPFGLTVLHNDYAPGIFITLDHAIDRHLLSVGYDPAAGQSLESFTPERCVELIRLVTESPVLQPRIQLIQPWETAAAVADRFRDGRILLAGDAAKVTPPSGGLGGNTAIGDAYDLSWKLAAVLKTTAGPGLLDTYDAERRPIADRVITEALRLLSARTPALADPSVVAEASTTVTEDSSATDRRRLTELVLGFRYRSSAILAADPADSEDPYNPTGRPGFRAPHIRLRRDDETFSTVDLFGDTFALLTGPDGHLWTDAAAQAAERLRIMLPTHPIGDQLTDIDGDFLRRYGIGPSGATLIRPDGVIAWRSPETPEHPTDVLIEVLTAILAR